jgi:hypothetical protein
VRGIWLVLVAGCGFAPAGFGGSANGSGVDAPHEIDAALLIDAPDASTMPADGWVQGTSGTGASGDLYQLGYPLPQHAGDLDVVIVTWGPTTTHVASVTDTLGDTFTRISSAFSTGAHMQAFYYAPAVAAGANTVTVQFDATADASELRIAEYAGIVAATPVEHYTFSNGTGQAMSETLIATTNAHDLLVAANTVESATDQTDPTYTLRLTENGDVLMDRIVNAPAQYSATAHQTGDVTWVFHVAAFKFAH